MQRQNNNPQPVVTVLMSVYNGEKYLSEAIESILSQTFTNFEFLIINDCSTDASRNIILSYTDHRILLIDNFVNIGLTKSLNIGINLAKGRFIARMDADDLSLPHRLEKQISFLKNNPEISLVGSSAIVINEEGLTIQNANVYLPSHQIFSKLFFGNTFVHTSILGNSNVFKNFKYNPAIKYAQDYYLLSQITEKHKVSNIEEALVKYRVHNKSISVSKLEMQEAYVKQTYSLHLSNLGIINITEKQLNMHYLLLRNKINPDLLAWKEIADILNWIELLRSQNDKLKVYNQIYFTDNLSIYWNLIFLQSFRFGVKALKFLQTPFNNDMGFDNKLRFTYKSLKKEVKKLFKI